MPVLILHGNNDRLVLPDHAWKMAEALFAHKKEHDIIVLYSPEEDTGHNLKGKALEEAHEHMLKWFNKISSLKTRNSLIPVRFKLRRFSIQVARLPKRSTIKELWLGAVAQPREGILGHHWSARFQPAKVRG